MTKKFSFILLSVAAASIAAVFIVESLKDRKENM